MKYLARIAALAGLAIAVWLVWHADARAVLGLMRAAGAGLALAGMARVLPMLANARNWQMLMRGQVAEWRGKRRASADSAAGGDGADVSDRTAGDEVQPKY